MPCYTPSYVYSKGDAILCSVFHQCERDGTLHILLAQLDYDLIGLSQAQVVEWWDSHKKLDKQKLKEMR